MSLTPSKCSDSLLLSKLSPSFHAFDYLKTYAAIQMVAQIVVDKNWTFPHAAFFHNIDFISKKLDIEWPSKFLNSATNKRDFSNIYSKFESMTFRDFLIEILPDFVTQLSKTFVILDTINLNIETKCLALLLAKKEWLRSLGDIFPKESYEAFVRECFTDEHWQSLIYAVNCYAFSYRSRILLSSNAAQKVLSEYHCPPDYQIALYGQVREKLVGNWKGRHTKWEKHIINGAHYIRAINGLDPQIDALAMDSAINEAAQSIGKIAKPTDFLEAVLVKDSNDDSKLENDFVHSKFVESLTANDNILIINPSPDFLCQYPESLLSKTTFSVPYEPMAWVLEHEFPASFSTFDDVVKHSLMPNEPVYTKILMFSREIASEVQEQLISVCSNALKPSGVFCAVLPANIITNEKPNVTALDSHFSIQLIDILPANSSKSSPRKKVYIQATHKSSLESLEIMNYELFTGNDDNQYLKRGSENPLVVAPDVIHTHKSIHALSRDLRFGTPQKTRNQPMQHRYSQDISFWYTITPSNKTPFSKIEAYVCAFPTEKQKKRRQLLRGNKIKDAYASKSNLESAEELDAWCETVLPYIPRIHRGVITAFKDNTSLLFSGQVSLKTLWYLQLDVDTLQTNPSFEGERDIFSSTIGKLCISAEPHEFEKAMEEYCIDKPLPEQSLCWNILSEILDYAVQNGYIERNQTAKIAQSYREKADHSIEAVRAALTKKTFHLEEEQKLLSFLYETIPEKSEYLSVLIRFFTGLEVNIVSALTWGDIHKIPGTNVHHFATYQQYKNNGDDLVPLKYSEDYRHIPITSTLYEQLKKRQNYIKKSLGLSKNEMAKLQIIATDKQITGEARSIVSPRKINDLSRKVVAAIGIDDIVVDLPSDENGTKETNFAKYHGDIFRTNFRHRAKSTCGFTDSELKYVLGLRQTSPFGKNYCDYSNPFAQLSMHQKLSRWDAVLFPSTTVPEYQQVEFPGELTITNSSSTVNAVMEFPLNSASGDTVINVSCSHGMSVQADIFSFSRTTSHHKEGSEDYAEK